MIPAVIIDDEENNRDVLKTLLQKHCPDISIAGEASGSDEGYVLINALKPALVFMDIRMPQKSGFDLLKRFTTIDFEVIFVTAFNKYAIKAFEFNAVGYILKPIDVSKLIKAVDKAKERISSESHNNPILHFVKTLSDKDELVSRFSVHHHGKVVFIEVPEVSFIEAKEHNTILTLANNSHFYSSKDLSKYESVLEATQNFIRINKSVIINTNYLKSYSKGEPCIIELKTGQVFEVSRRRKTEILKKLKEL